MHARDDYRFRAAAPAVVAGVLAVVIPNSILAALFATLALIALFAAAPMLGWITVVLLYPFIYLQLFIGRHINVPYVDVVAMLTAAGVGVRFLVERWRTGQWHHIPRIPGLVAFFCFIVIAAASLVNVGDLLIGVKFLLRPLTFSYAMFVVLPLVIIDSPKRLFTTFRALFAVGVAVTLMGAWSLAFPPEPGIFRRAVPVAIGSLTPLGTNYNLIAEVLVSIIPVGIVLAAFARGVVRRWYVVGTAAMALVTLLTFSRNGWLTLAFEGVVLIVALARARGITWRRILTVAAPIVVTAVIAVGAITFSDVARSSNQNRIQLTQIAIAQFKDHPVLGGGVGTFIEAVSRDRWYIADFGVPQEAHGVVQKLIAETGMLGLITFLWLLSAVVYRIIVIYQQSSIAPPWRFILTALLCASVGSIVFQLFNTSYFVSKLWLPLGVGLAAARLAEDGIRLRGWIRA